MTIIDLTGMTFGQLTVLSIAENKGSNSLWNCKCSCGKTKIITGDNLRYKNTKTCGNCRFVNDKVIWEFKEDYVIGYSKTGKKFYIDTEDYEKLKEYNLTVNSRGYVLFTLNKRSTTLHRFLMSFPEGMTVDHINRNPSDNRKSNLRICTIRENSMNRKRSKVGVSGSPGVYFNKKKSKWIARIMVNGKSKQLGSFENKEDAVKARKEGEQKYFGDFAPK